MTAGAAVGGNTYHVNADCGDDAWSGLSPNCAAPDGPKATIQAALDVTEIGDTVVVAPGTYYENIRVETPRIIVESQAPSDPAIVAATIIDGGRKNSVVRMSGAQGYSSRLSGFTLRNGLALSGGGIDGTSTCATISNCVVVNNEATVFGGGLYKCKGRIDSCTIIGNVAGDHGGGLAKCNGLIVNCMVAGNTAQDFGGGLGICVGTIAHCTICGNSARSGGGVLATYTSQGMIGYQSLVNCILWGNTAESGTQIRLSTATEPATLAVSFCDVQGGPEAVYVDAVCTLDWGEGNIDEDPAFYIPGDYHLRADSPCIDTGVSPGTLTDTDADGNPRPIGDGFDMGAYEYNPSSPSIAVLPREMVFLGVEGEADPDAQSFLVGNCGSGTLHWSAAADAEWVQLDPPLGTSTGQTDQVTVSVDLSGLARGRYAANITVADPNAVNSPRGVHVRLTVASTLTVCQDGSADYTTIQAAIDDSLDGDTIVVCPGTYCENVQFDGQPITVRSVEPADPETVAGTVIDGQMAGPVVAFSGRETAETTLSGLTITNGSSNQGGGISGPPSASPGSLATISNCVITNNQAVDYAGLLNCDGLIEGCKIVYNKADRWGGGLGGCDGTIANCDVRDNCAGFGGGMSHCSGVITSCAVWANYARNSGGGLYRCNGAISGCVIYQNRSDAGGGLNDCTATLTNCVVVENIALAGGGLYSCCASIAHCTIANNMANAGGGIHAHACSQSVEGCVLWGNVAQEGPAIAVDGSLHPATLIVGRSDVQGGLPDLHLEGDYTLEWDPNNIDVDPQFFLAGDYHLEPTSPCIDAGNDLGVSEDVDGNARPLGDGYDLGAYEYNATRPSIALAPLRLEYVTSRGGPSPEAQQLQVANCGGDTLYWSVSTDVPWLQPNPSSGSSAGEEDIVILAPETSQLGHGRHIATLTATAPDAVNIPRTVVVDLLVNDTFSVKADGTGDYSTIQAAIDDAFDGDTIIVWPGTYEENIHFHGKRIVLQSTDPSDSSVAVSTVIDGAADGPVVRFSGEEGPDTVLSGFTITHGAAGSGCGVYGFGHGATHATISRCMVVGNTAAENGGGINSCDGRIAECIIAGNSAAARGGGLYECDGSIEDCLVYGNTAGSTGGGMARCSGEIVDCIIHDNVATTDGGGLSGCNGTVTRCVIAGNTVDGNAGGISCYGGIVSNCTIVCNTATGLGGGVYSRDSTIRHCTIAANQAAFGGGVACVAYPTTLLNAILSSNSAATGPQLALEQSFVPYEPETEVSVSYCQVDDGQSGVCVEGGSVLHWGIGNITDAPLFADEAGADGDPNTWADNDYHLAPESPCINAGDPNDDYGSQTDIDGEVRVLHGRTDMGSDEFSGAFVPRLLLSRPSDDGTLPRIGCNAVLLTFNGEIALPGETAPLEVVPLAGGSSVTDRLAFSIMPDGVTLCAEEVDPLPNQTWYRLMPTPEFVVMPFVLDVCTLWGDVDLSRRVTTGDYIVVKTHMGQHAADACAYEVWDVNCSGRVTTADYAVVKQHMGDRPPPKP